MSAIIRRQLQLYVLMGNKIYVASVYLKTNFANTKLIKKIIKLFVKVSISLLIKKFFNTNKHLIKSQFLLVLFETE